ncbi:MAG: PAS domain S-box protein, partial [Ferruginibacter sp.]
MKTAAPFNHLFENILKPVYTCDPKGYITYYNKAAANLWGRNPEKGKELWCGSWKAFHPDGTLIPNDHTPMANAVKTKQPVKGEEIIIQRPDGTYRYVRQNPSPVFDENGNFTGGINILVDITDRIEKERNHNNQFKTLVEQAADGIFLFAENGRFLSANKSGASMLGYS